MESSELDGYTCQIKNIKIVPSLNNTLSALGLNTQLEQDMHNWLYQLKMSWKMWKKSLNVENYVTDLFFSRPDPYRIALVFVINCEEYNDCKPKTLPYFIIEILLKCSKNLKVPLDESLKIPAFNIALEQRNQNFFSLMANTYQLSTVKSTILPFIQEMIKKDNCKQASQIAIAMELYDDIPVQDLLFPLLLQDKSKLVDDYLSQCPNQAKLFVQFLDTLLDKNFKLLDFVQSYVEKNNVNHIKPDKVHYKPLGKIVARLCNKYNIPIETCKNLSKNRTTSGLKYLVYQKYVEHNVSSSVWEDLVKDSLKQSQDSGLEFIKLLADYDKNEALKWAKHLNIPDAEVPLALKLAMVQDNESQEENWDTDLKEDQKDDPKEYYETCLTKEQIVIIDSVEKFYDLIMTHLKNPNIVSLDCEWKPSFGAKQSQVALIQLGVNNKVFLLDTIILNKQENASIWHTFNKSFLDNAEIIKLGFGLEQDLKEMKTIVGLSNIKMRGEGLLDLNILWKSLINHGLSIPGASDSGSSLSSLVQSCFGKPLEKSEQCSNWELRPLRETQILYAAIDAHVLIQIYYYLHNKCLEQGINFEEISNEVMVESKKKVTKKPKVVERIHQSFSLPLYEAKPASKVKFLVDFTITNLLPYLRFCGIDSVAIPTTMLWHDVIYQAISDECFILLSKYKNTPNSNFPQSSILCVGKVPVMEQLHTIINSFQLSITFEDLMSICLYCNGKDLKKVSNDEVTKIYQSYRAVADKAECTKYVCVDETEEIDFGNFLSDSETDDEVCHTAKPGNHSSNDKCPTTSKGIQIIIDDFDNLSLTKESQESGVLCEDCGKLFLNHNLLVETVRNTVLRVTKLNQPT